jgi:hypothetical protein
MKIHDPEYNMTAEILPATTGDGFTVSIIDDDSGNMLPVHYKLPTAEAAEAKAREILFPFAGTLTVSVA